MNDLLFVREMHACDLTDILAINSSGLPGVSHLDAGNVTSLISMAPIAWVAVVEGRVAGYLIGFLAESSNDGQEFQWFKRRQGHFIYVDQVAIAPSFRGQGIGRRLYEELAQWGTQHGCPTLVCEVNLVPPNPVSLEFHKRFGFSEVGRLSVHDGRDVVLLEYAANRGRVGS